MKNSTSVNKRARGRPRSAEAADIDQFLLDCAQQEFLQHGYGGASLSRMVREAGISKTTLYSRYPSKEAVFLAIINRQIQQLAPESLLLENGKPMALVPGLKRYADHMLEVSLDYDMLGINRLMYSESHRFPELGEAAAMRTQLGIKRITEFLHADGKARAQPYKNPKAVAEVFILSIRGWYIDAMLTNRVLSVRARRKFVDQTLSVLLASQADW